jgi:hypothetical protein
MIVEILIILLIVLLATFAPRQNPHGYQPIPDPSMPKNPPVPRGSSGQSDLSGYRVDTADPNVVVNEKKWTHYDYEKEYNKRVAPVDTTEATE